MSKRKRNRTGKRRRAARAGTVEQSSEWSGELDRLRRDIEGDRNLLDRLSMTEYSPAAASFVEHTRQRYEHNLHHTCEVLEQCLADAEARASKLAEHNRALIAANEQLSYKVDKLLLELRQALGIKATTRDHDDEGQQASSQPPSDTGNTATQDRKGKRGAPKGHRGRTRPVPAVIDSEDVIAPTDLCDCGGGDISPLLDFDTRYIEDIAPVTRHVTRRIYLHGRCQHCGKVVRHPDVLNGPQVITGPNLAAHLTMLNHMGMTFRKLSALSTNTLGIDLSPAGALGIVNRVGASLRGPYAELLGALPDQDWLNGDETGWKVMGRNGYIWCFCNSTIAFFHHDCRRSAKVIEEILGESFPGIVVCDFYAAYNCIDQTQRCLVHLLRDIKKEREVLADSKMLERFDEAVRNFIQSGLDVQAMPDGPRKDKAVAKLRKKLDQLTRMKVTKGKATTLVKRINKYRDDLIHFVTHPGVEFHNNRAERQLRPIVVSRKVSFGSSTDQGARRYCIIHTIVETCKLQGIDPIEYLRRAYTSAGLDLPNLTGADPPIAA